MDWGVILGIIGAVGIPLALTAIGISLAVGASPTKGEMNAARICFIAAALIMSVGVFLTLWNYPEGSRTMRTVLAATTGALIFGGLALALDWVSKKENPETTEKKIDPASLLLNCQFSRLPTVVPASGQIWTMDIISKKEFGAEPAGLGGRTGQPGEVWTWFEKDRELGGVSRCDITNYADFPIFNVVMVFKQEFLEAKKSADNPGATSSGDMVDTSDRQVVINNIDAKATFSFFAYSQSLNFFVQVRPPAEVTYLRAGSDVRETANLLPSTSTWMSFSPSTIKPPPKVEPSKPEAKKKRG